MNITESILAQAANPEMPRELSWAIITLLAGIIVWVTIRYINRLDEMLKGVDNTLKSMSKILIEHEQYHKNHTRDIENNTKDIEELQKEARIRPKRR